LFLAEQNPNTSDVPDLWIAQFLKIFPWKQPVFKTAAPSFEVPATWK
jgi:hypothetical protein